VQRLRRLPRLGPRAAVRLRQRADRVNNPNAQRFQRLVKDGVVGENAVQTNTALINALRYGGDILNVFGDFPTLIDPRQADTYSPLWDARS
jgi:hypothetical protein